MTSTSSSERLDWNVSGVPHRGQKVRLPCAEERKLAGSPAEKAKSETGTLNHETNGAPLARRQIEQWQFVSLEGDVPAW